MAAYGGGAIAGGSGVTQVDTAAINVTGTDVMLVMAASAEASATRTLTLSFDPTGTNQTATGQFETYTGIGGYLYGEMEYIDDPTAANAVVRVSTVGSCDGMGVGGMFFTAAGDGVAADSDQTTYTSGTSFSATVPNAASGDIICDFIHYDPGGNPGTAATVGSNQTSRGDSGSTSNYSRFAMSTQAGADGGVMTWTVPTTRFGGAIMAARIPDAGGGGGGNSTAPLGGIAGEGGLAGPGGIAGRGGIAG